MRFIICIAAIFSAGLFAKEPSITYSSPEQELTIKDKTCLYGRDVKTPLQNLVLERTRRYALANQAQLARKLMREHSLKRAQTQYIHLLLTSKLDVSTFQYDYELNGNDTCVTANATLNIKEQVDFATLFEFSAPSRIHLEVQQDNFNSQLERRLSSMALPVSQKHFNQHAQLVSEYNRGAQRHQYYEFDLKAYLADVAVNKSTVVVEGNSVFTAILRSYLQNKNYRIVAPGQAAYWTIDVEASIEQEKFVNITLTITGRENESIVLVNNSRKLPPSNLTNPVLLEKFTKVHFELMQLVQNLAP